MIDLGAEVASVRIAGIDFTSLTGASGFSEEARVRRDCSSCGAVDAERIDERHFGGNAAVFERGAGAVGNVDEAVHEVGSVLAKIVATDVGSDAYDGAPVVLSEKAQVFSDGVLAGPEAARGFGADDGSARVAGGVGFGEFAAAQKRDPHGAEIAGRDGVEPKEWLGLVVGGQVVFAHWQNAWSLFRRVEAC